MLEKLLNKIEKEKNVPRTLFNDNMACKLQFGVSSNYMKMI